MKIAIIGAGLSGLSLAWHLSQSGKADVTLFDPSLLTGGASGIAAGLMHPYPGQEGKRSFLATEGIAATKRLLQIAQQKSPTPVANDKGIIRYPQSEEMRSLFFFHAEKQGDIKLIEENAFLIQSGMTIFCRRYLQGLWLACQESGVKLESQPVTDLQDLASYDQIVLAAGAGNCAFAETKALRIELLKGQILKCQIPHEISFPKQSMIGKGYIAHAPEEGFCYIGSTYERGQTSAFPDIEKAKAEIFPNLALFYPSAQTFPIIECQAAFRVMRIGHYYPMAGRLKNNVWICTALGSRGLLYHGLVAEKLSEAILSDDESAIPKEFSLDFIHKPSPS